MGVGVDQIGVQGSGRKQFNLYYSLISVETLSGFLRGPNYSVAVFSY